LLQHREPQRAAQLPLSNFDLPKVGAAGKKKPLATYASYFLALSIRNNR
jgi:hypothetical protein